MDNVLETLVEVRQRAEGNELSSCQIRQVDLRALDMSGWRFHDVALRQVGLGAVNMQRAHLVDCRIQEASMRAAELTESRIAGTSFFNSELIEARLGRSSLVGAKFYDSRLPNARFDGARLLSCVFDGCDMRYLHAPRAFLVNCVFEDRRLGNIDMNGADLRDAVLVDVDLRDANLFRANLSGALLVNVDLRGANLTGVDVTGAHLVSVRTERAEMDEGAQELFAARGPVDIPAALSGLTPDMLRELSSHLIGTYVLGGQSPVDTAGPSPRPPAGLDGLSFQQLVTTLKMQLEIPELELFSVSGPDVFVRIGGRDVPLSAAAAEPPAREVRREVRPAPAGESRPAAAPAPGAPAAEPRAAEPRPAESRSSGGGGPRMADPFGGSSGRESPASRSAREASERRSSRAEPDPAPAPRSRRPEPAPAPASKDDRFGMLEID